MEPWRAVDSGVHVRVFMEGVHVPVSGLAAHVGFYMFGDLVPATVGLCSQAGAPCPVLCPEGHGCFLSPAAEKGHLSTQLWAPACAP